MKEKRVNYDFSYSRLGSKIDGKGTEDTFFAEERGRQSKSSNSIRNEGECRNFASVRGFPAMGSDDDERQNAPSL